MIVDRNEARLLQWCRGPNYVFLPPWFDAQCFGGFEFWPIRTHAELRDETMNMNHCIVVAARLIAEGHVCAISIQQGGARVASALLALTSAGRRDIGDRLLSVYGYRGALVPEIEAIVRAWLASLIVGPSNATLGL